MADCIKGVFGVQEENSTATRVINIIVDTIEKISETSDSGVSRPEPRLGQSKKSFVLGGKSIADCV